MQTQLMVWLAAASLHEQGRAPFRRKDLLEEVNRMFPAANPTTVAGYASGNTNVSSSSVYSFGYLIKTERGTYHLTKPGDPNPLGKPRWPREGDVGAAYLDLWRRWADWQAGAVPAGLTEEQELLAKFLVSVLPASVVVERAGSTIKVERDFEICARIQPEQFWMQTVRTRWDGQTPVPEPDRELTLRLPVEDARGAEVAALAVVALVEAVFGERLRSYARCSDCGELFAPEHMTEAWCHGCASAHHGVTY
jgi:hypothetical protein